MGGRPFGKLTRRLDNWAVVQVAGSFQNTIDSALLAYIKARDTMYMGLVLPVL